MKELTMPDMQTDTSFVANGKTYMIESRLSIARKMRSDALMIEIGAGVTPGEQFNLLKQI
jgi:hypothetical protein